jgi:hypothetical protein
LRVAVDSLTATVARSPDTVELRRVTVEVWRAAVEL